MDNIEMRLQRLEKSNRRYKNILVLLTAFFAITIMAFKSRNAIPELLQAKRFEVLDDNGQVLVRLSQDDGKGIIKTFNQEGKKLVNITYTTHNEGFIGLEDGKGHETIRCSSSNDGGGGFIGIFNPSGNRTLTFSNDLSGGNIYVGNAEGNTRAVIQCNTSAGGFMGLYNQDGYTAVKLTQTSSGNGDLYVNDSKGDERVRLSVSPNAGNFQIRNASKTMIVELGGTNGSNGTINTYNSTGTFVQGIGSSY
jgi:hypothetical protein